MKRILAISGLMMAAIVALSGCQTEVGVEIVSKKVLTVTAFAGAETRTVNDGMSTLWSEGDQISVFYADAGGNMYSEGIVMTLSDGAGTKGGVFVDAKGSAIPDGSHDWYAIYPSGPKSPASSSADGGWTYVGDTRGVEQPFYDDMSALCRTACPMYGVIRNVGADPGFVMKQLATVIEFNVINKTGSPVKVKTVTLDESESGENICGRFYVDFTGEKPEFVDCVDAQWLKTVSSAKVLNPAELSEEQTAKIYLPVKPYAHDPMKAFKVIVEGEVNGQAASQTILLQPTPQQCLFEAGKIRKVHVVLDDMQLLESSFATIAQLNQFAATAGTYTGSFTNAVVSFVPNADNAFIRDDSGSILFYKKDHGLKQGQTFSGEVNVTTTVFKGLIEITDWNAEFTGDEAVVAPRELTLADVAGHYDTYQSEYVTISNMEVVSIDGKNINVKEKDGTAEYIVFANAGTPDGLKAGDIIAATGTITKYNTTEELKVWTKDGIDVGGDEPGPGPDPQGTTVSVEMGDYVTANGCTLSSGNDVVCYKTLDLSSAVRMSTTGSGNCGSFWKPKSTVEWRLYQNKDGDVTITVADGCELQLIQFTFTTDNSGILQSVSGDTVVSGEGMECSGTSATFTVGNSTEKTNGQVKITAVKVVYTGDGTLSPVEPEPDPEPDAELKLNGKNSLTLNFVATQAERQIVTVTCDNNDWTVTGAPDWVTVDTNTEPGKIIIGVEDNAGDERSVDLSVNHSNGEITRTLTVFQAGAPSGDTGSYTATLTNADIVAAGDASDGYKEWTVTDSAGNEYNAYAIKKAHSKATSTNHYLQIKKYASNTASYIRIPTLGTKIVSITMTVSNANQPMSGGGNTATLFFSASDSTSAAGEGVASGVGASSVTIDASSLNLNTGYITTSAGVRIWDIVITYD